MWVQRTEQVSSAGQAWALRGRGGRWWEPGGTRWEERALLAMGPAPAEPGRWLHGRTRRWKRLRAGEGGGRWLKSRQSTQAEKTKRGPWARGCGEQRVLLGRFACWCFAKWTGSGRNQHHEHQIREKGGPDQVGEWRKVPDPSDVELYSPRFLRPGPRGPGSWPAAPGDKAFSQGKSSRNRNQSVH